MKQHFDKKRLTVGVFAFLLFSEAAVAGYCIQIASAPMSQKDMLIAKVGGGAFGSLPALRVERRGSLAVVRAGDFATYREAAGLLPRAKSIRGDAFVRTCTIDPQNLLYTPNDPSRPAATSAYRTPAAPSRIRTAPKETAPVPTPAQIDRYIGEENYMRHEPVAPQPRLDPVPPSYYDERPYEVYRRDYREQPRRDLPPPYPETAGRRVAPSQIYEIESAPPAGYVERDRGAYETSPLNALAYDRDARLWEECQKCFSYRDQTEAQSRRPAPSERQYRIREYPKTTAPQTRAPEKEYHPRPSNPYREEGRIDRYIQADPQSAYREPERAAPRYRADRNVPERVRPEDTRDFWLNEMKKELNTKPRQ